VANKKYPTEGGNARGHSNMEHSLHTEEIKTSARKARRRTDRAEVKERFDEAQQRAFASPANREVLRKLADK
jgi:hypothetical protein